MSPEQTKTLSDFLNRTADLPVEVQAIADQLKAELNPAPVEAEVEETTTAPVEAEAAPVEESNG